MSSVALIYNDLRVVNASNFINVYDATPSVTNYLYLGISGTTPWGDEVNPPAPLGKLDENTEFWSEMIGMHRVQVTDLCHVVPRVDWTSGVTYAPIDTSLVDPWAAANKAYVLSSNNSVYLCITAGGGASTAEPTHTVGGTGQAEGDGYTWAFLYDLASYDQTNLLTTSWLPVNWGEKESTLQGTNGDIFANSTINAKYVMVRARLIDTDLPVDVTYRKLALLSNPFETGGTVPCTSNNYVIGGIESGTGELVYEERRPPITRNTGQFEEIKIVVEF